MAGYLGRNTMADGKTPLPIIQTGPMAGQLDINALVGQLMSQQKTYAYDTLKIPSGSTVAQQPYRLFQTPIGQPDPYNGGIVKTEQETNLSTGGQFSPPTDFILNNLGFYFLAGNQLFDISQICNLGWFEFKVMKKTWWMGHLVRHPSGMGLSGQSNVSGDHMILNGVAEPSKVWHFGDWKLYIPPQVQFSLTLNFTETYDNFYNVTGQGGAATNIPADIQAKIITPAVNAATSSSRPTLLPQSAGGTGIQLLVVMNGISNGPVQ
jgi:hypothetical protein